MHLAAAAAALIIASPTFTQASLAGYYFTGNGFTSRYLALMPGGAFSEYEDTCVGGETLATGRWVFDGERVLLKRVVLGRSYGMRPGAVLDRTYTPVLWGMRIYLVSQDEMQEFCNSLNGGIGFKRRSERFFCAL